MLRWLKTLFGKKNYEFLYFYITHTEEYGFNESLKSSIFSYIKLDLNNKVIKDTAIFSGKNMSENLIMLTTEKLTLPYYQPLILEIYAFLKREKDYSVFSYKYTEKAIKYFIEIERNNKLDKKERFLTILKFKIEC